MTNSIDMEDGGPSRSVPILAKGLSSIGVDTVLMSCFSSNMNKHLIEGTNVALKVIPTNITYNDLEDEILSGNYDLIHCQNLWDPIYNKIAKIARKYDIPYMMTPRGCLEPWAYQGQGFIKNIKKKLAMMLYQKRDLQKSVCILATANMEADNIRRLGIKTPIAIVPNGIDVSEYKCRSVDFKASVKKQLMFLSRIHQKKGIEFLINAWEQLHTKYPDWNIIIAGNGEESYIKQLKDMILLKKLQNCVQIIPPVFGESKRRLYYESSLFILPTYSENFGMVIAEAMSCGVPCITTNGTPWQELNDKNLGWCIELNQKNLISTISKAIDLGVDTLFDIGQSCSKHIYDTYQYTEVAAKNKAVYDWIVNGSSKPDFVV